MVRSQKGFTLIEILIVIAIIGILAFIGLNSFMSAQAKGRDARRKSDLQQISKALEQYYNDFGTYPDDTSIASETTDFLFAGCGSNGTDPCEAGDAFQAGSVIYMAKLPGDPRSGSYFYETPADTSSYQLYARLENPNDPAAPVVLGKAGNYGISCTSGNCNFGVSSSNTTPETGRTLQEDSK